jgi:signal transduction histidine kinase
MANRQSEPKRDVWEQWDWVWHVCAYAFLGLNVAFDLAADFPTEPIWLFLGLSALLAIWYLPFVAAPITHWWNSPGRGMLYFLIGWALWAGLLALNERSLMLAAMFYPMIFSRFPIRWAIAVAFAQTLGLSALFLLLYNPENWLVTLVIAFGILLAAILIGLFISALVNQSLERQRLLDEFTKARASLLKMEREAGELAERQRLAREIHDTLTQQFTSIIMHLSAAGLSDPDTAQARVQQAEQAARDGLDEARRMIWGMRPEQLENDSLVERLEKLVARWSVENDVNVAVTVTGIPKPIDTSINVALLRISQEALHNIQKHACAQNVNITLSYMSDALALDVADDGRGFRHPQERHGFGFKSMRERAQELGGELSIESEPGRGMKVAVSITLAEAA